MLSEAAWIKQHPNINHAGFGHLRTKTFLWAYCFKWTPQRKEVRHKSTTLLQDQLSSANDLMTDHLSFIMTKGGRSDRYIARIAPVHYLFFSLGFLYIVPAHFDPWGQNGTCEFHDVHAEQVAKLLSSCETQNSLSTKILTKNGHILLHVCRTLAASLMDIQGLREAQMGHICLNVRSISNKKKHSGHYCNLLSSKTLTAHLAAKQTLTFPL